MSGIFRIQSRNSSFLSLGGISEMDNEKPLINMHNKWTSQDYPKILCEISGTQSCVDEDPILLGHYLLGLVVTDVSENLAAVWVCAV
jgi:hypothetical protein